ncbi:MAG: aminopeptidase P family protein [Planctomycetes bacterium]|nr:aminopeptidase P family protein [Planctomycetota bacterium]
MITDTTSIIKIAEKNRREQSGGNTPACLDRREVLRRELSTIRCGAAVLTRSEDYYYYTGYTGEDAVAIVAARSGKTWLLTDPRYREEAERTARGCEVVMWKRSPANHTGVILRKLRSKTVGITANHMTVQFLNTLRAAAPALGTPEDIGPIISRQRAVKSSGEIRAMRNALACAEKSFITARARWKIGMTEMDVKNDLEWEMRRNGASGTAFDTIVAVGPNASLPHAHAGNRKLAAGKMLLIDFGAHLGQYNSDLTRTLWLSDIPAVWKKRYNAVRDAQLAAIDAIGPGVPGSDVHQVAATVLAKYGLGKFFTHGLGHGVGLVVHEDPRLSPSWDKPLEPGHIITVEPGVYFPGSGGIRTEDMVLVTAKGREVLSSLAKDVDSMIVP